MTTEPINSNEMTYAEFEQFLPEFFAGGGGSAQDDPRLRQFLAKNPDCEALIRDLKYIAETARKLLEPAEEEPSDNVWNNIQNKLGIAAAGEDPQ